MALPDDEAYDVDMAAEVNVRYVDYLKDGVLHPPSIVEARVSAKANPDKDVIKPSGGDYVPRRAKITRKDLRRHGYTAGCPGCIAMESESGRRAMHSRECRDRLERLMPEDRLKRAKDRLDEWTAAQGESMMVDGATTARDEDFAMESESKVVRGTGGAEDDDDIDGFGGMVDVGHGRSPDVGRTNDAPGCVTPVGRSDRELLMNGESPY